MPPRPDSDAAATAAPEPVVSKEEGAERIPIVYGYGRVSTPRMAKEGLSLAVQQERIKAFYDYALPKLRWGGCFVDAGVSAFKKKLAQRKAGGQLCRRLRAGDHVVFPRLDRAFRRAADSFMTIEEWHSKGIVVHVLDFGVDTSKPSGRLMLNMLACFAEFERESTAERTAIVMAYRKKRTGSCNQHAGYGRKLVGRKGSKRAVEDPEECAAMRTIVALHDEKGLSFREIYWHFIKAGITARGGKTWSKNRIHRAYQACKLQAPAPPQGESSSASSACATPATD